MMSSCQNLSQNVTQMHNDLQGCYAIFDQIGEKMQ